MVKSEALSGLTLRTTSDKPAGIMLIGSDADEAAVFGSSGI